MSDQKTAPRSQTALPKTDFIELLPELNAGVLLQQINAALSDVGLATAVHGDKGKEGEVTLKFKMKRIGETTQVELKHTLGFSKPTARGKSTEEATTTTPVYVCHGGRLSVLPEEQPGLDFGQG